MVVEISNNIGGCVGIGITKGIASLGLPTFS